jgi:predicted transcriptional regulator
MDCRAGMKRKKIKKSLIEPKVRLLLWIYFRGISEKDNWRTRLAKSIDYGKGNVDTQLVDLLDKGFIQSLNPNNKDPPYRITDEGKKFLQPILFTSRIGMAVSLWVAIWAIIDYLEFLNQPVLMITYWLPLLIVSFAILAVVLIFYPYLLLKLGKTSY